MKNTMNDNIDSYFNQLGDPEWMRDKREKAWIEFQNLVMPDRKVETWRRTDISDLNLDAAIQHVIENDNTLVEKEVGDCSWLDGTNLADYIVQKNSLDLSCRENSSNDSSLIYMDMKSALQTVPDLVKRYFLKEDSGPLMKKFELLHEALWSGGVFLYVPLGTYVVLPVSFFQSWNSKSRLASPHNLIVLEESSSAIFYEESRMENRDSQGIYLGYTEVYLEKDAKLTYASINNHGDTIYSFPYRLGVIEGSSELNWVNLELGGKTSKTFTETRLTGSDSSSNISELYIGTGHRHIDITPTLTHNATNTKGEIMAKGVLYKKSRSVFQGLIDVRKEAFGTDSYLSNRNLMMGDDARADTIPKLEINTNDVKASHGATVGEPDPEHLFYMMSRGLSEKDAEAELVRGFIEPILSEVPHGYPLTRASEMVGGILRQEHENATLSPNEGVKN